MAAAILWRRTWARTAAFSLAGFVLLGFLVWKADPVRVASVLREADAKWIVIMLLGLIVATLLGAVNSYLIVSAGSGLSFGSFLGAYWCAWALGQVVPGQVGDLIGISLFLRRRGLALPTAVGRLGVDKLISLFCLLLFSAGLMAIFDVPGPRIGGALGACAALALVVAYFFSLRWNVASIGGVGLRGQLTRALCEAHIVVKTQPIVVAVNLSLTVVKLLLVGFCYWATFCALHHPTGYIDATVTANSVGLIAYVPISANGVGTVEAGAIYLFGLLGFHSSEVVAAYLILRIASLGLALGGAALVLLLNAILLRVRPSIVHGPNHGHD